MSATAIMERFGCVVVAAESAVEAIALMHANNFVPDMVLADYRLRDGTTGSEATQTVSARFKRSTPAAILTGETAPDRLRKVQASGLTLVHKPLSGAKLRALLSSFLLPQSPPASSAPTDFTILSRTTPNPGAAALRRRPPGGVS